MNRQTGGTRYYVIRLNMLNGKGDKDGTRTSNKSYRAELDLGLCGKEGEIVDAPG